MPLSGRPASRVASSIRCASSRNTSSTACSAPLALDEHRLRAVDEDRPHRAVRPQPVDQPQLPPVRSRPRRRPAGRRLGGRARLATGLAALDERRRARPRDRASAVGRAPLGKIDRAREQAFERCRLARRYGDDRRGRRFERLVGHTRRGCRGRNVAGPWRALAARGRRPRPAAARLGLARRRRRRLVPRLCPPARAAPAARRPGGATRSWSA